MKKFGHDFICNGLLLCGLLVAHPSWAVDLSSTLWQVLESDPRVLAARSNYQSRLVEAEGAYAAYLPVVRGTGSTGSSKSSDPLTRDGSKRVFGLEIEQPIPLFGRESARVELARVAARIEAAEVTRVEQAVLADVLEALLNYGLARKALAVRERLLDNLREQVAAVRTTVAGGGMKATELRLAQSRASQSEALRARAEANRAETLARLKRMVPGSLIPSLREDDLRMYWSGPLTAEAFEAAALQGAPALLKAQAVAEQAAAEHTVARADLWPKFSVTLQSQKGRFGAASADSNSVYFGFSAPLYEGGASVGRVKSSEYRVIAAKETAAHERAMTSQRIDEAWAQWQAAGLMALAWRESELQEEETIRLTEQQLAGGAATQVGLLRAQQNWLDTLLQGVDYRAQRDLAWVRLLHEAGALSLEPTNTQKKD